MVIIYSKSREAEISPFIQKLNILRWIKRMKPVGERKPDFERFRRAVTTREPCPVPVGDLFADFDMVSRFLNEKIFDIGAILSDSNRKITLKDIMGGYRYIEQIIRFCSLAGWDYAYSYCTIPFPGVEFDVRGNRPWMNKESGPIQSWDDFERYRWPRNIKAITAMSKVAARRVPEGMKLMVISSGIYEWTVWLMGMVPFCYALSEQPDLVDAVIDKITETVLLANEELMDEPDIGGIFMGDDLGYFSGTMISPRVLREKFLPHTKKVIDLVHSAGKIFVFHSCGNMYEIMDDLCDIGIDAKHSFEDKIMPVEEGYRRWGDRIALFGGVDMDILARGTEEEVRRRTREILDVCAPAGHYILGTGNSVASYLSIKNYLAMIDEGDKWNRENFKGEC